MRRLVAALALVCSVAQAQGPVVDAARFSPLDVGDQWKYYSTELYGPVPVSIYSEWTVSTVDRDTLIGGETYVVIVTERAPTSGMENATRTTCAFNRVLGAAPTGTTTLPRYDCSRALVLPPPVPWTAGPTTITTGTSITLWDQSVPVDSLLTFGSQQAGSGQAYTSTSYRYATGIGFVSSRRWGRTHETPQGRDDFDDNTVLYEATIDGVQYGGFVVAADPAAAPAAGFSLSTFPNPSAGPIRVAAAGASGRVTIDVFDALGRHVDGGTVQGAAPFTFRASAAGVYVVRATDEAGRVATERVVRR